MSPCLASSRDAAEWQLVDTRRLPRHAFDRMIAFAGGDDRDCDAFTELVSLRNALTPAGSLLVVTRSEVTGDLHDLAARAGFTRVRALAPLAEAFWTVELKR